MLDRAKLAMLLRLAAYLPKALSAFKEPKKALFVIVATAFALLVLGQNQHHGGANVPVATMTAFAGTLALILGGGFLGLGARAMRNNASNLGVLMGACALIVLYFGLNQIFDAGGTQYGKDVAALIGSGILGFFAGDEGGGDSGA